MLVESVILLIASVICFICSLGLISLWNRTRHAVPISLMILSSAMWSLFIVLFLETKSEFFAGIYTSMFYASAALTTLFGMSFALSYVVKDTTKGRTTQIIAFSLASFAIIVFCCIPNLLFSEVDIQHRNVHLNTIPYIIYGIYIGATFIITSGLFIAAIRKRDNRLVVRAGLRKILVLWAVAGSAAAFFNLILPFLDNYTLIWIGPLMIVYQVPMTLVLATSTEHFSIGKIFVKGTITCLMAALAILGAIFIYAMLELAIPDIYRSGTSRYSLYGFSFALSVLWSWAILRLNRRIVWQIDSDGFDEVELISTVSRITAIEHDPREFFRVVRHTLDKAFGVRQVDIMVFNENTAVHIDSIVEDTLFRLVGVSKRYAIYRGDVHSKKDFDMLVAHDIEVVVPIIGAIGGHAIGAIVLSPRRRKFDRYYGEVLEKVSAILAPFIQSSVYHKEILKMNNKMKEEIARKTQKLRDSNKELLKLDEMKSDLLTIASHNLRTPITGITGYSEMLLNGSAGPLSNTQRSYIEAIMRSGNTMRQMVSSLLDVSHIDAGDFVLHAEPFDLSALIREELVPLKKIAEKKGIEVGLKCGNNIELVGDIARIKQVVINLVDNAIYYGKRKVDVALEKVDGHITFKVKDDGIGVPKDEQHKIFGKMYRASNAEIKRPDGTGVGLYVAKNTIEASGGELIFESTEGKGSTFGFKFKY